MSKSKRYSFIVLFGVGLTILSLFLILLGLIGIYTEISMYIVLALLIFAGVWRCGSLFHQNGFTFESWEKEQEFLPMIMRICLTVMLVVCFASLMTPETRHDPYDYHLTVPTLYLAYEYIAEIPWHVFTYMPKNGEILYGLGLGVGNDSVTKLFHFIFGCLCIFTISTFMKEIGNKKVSILAALLTVTLPLFGFLSTSSYIDLARAYWELLALYCLFHCWNDEPTDSSGWLVLSALFAGMALGTKYVAWLVFLPPYSILFGLCFAHRYKNRKRTLFVIPFVFMLPFIPWLILNVVWTSNPFYPLFPSIFGMNTPAAKEAYEFFRGHAPPADVYTLSNIFPYIFMRFHRLLLDGNALVLVGIMAILMLPWWRKQLGSEVGTPFVWKGLNLYIVLSGTIFLLACNNDDGRFCFSAIATLSIPAAMFLLALHDYVQKNSSLGQIVLPFIVLVFFLNGLMFRKSQIQDLNEAIMPIITESQREEWLSRKFPNYPLVQWANEHLPENAFVLGMGYPLQRKHISGVKYGYIPFFEGIDPEISPQELSSILQKNGVTHLVKPFHDFSYSIDFSILLAHHLEPEYQYRGMTLYSLTESNNVSN